MSEDEAAAPQASEEELRAAYEAEIKKIGVADVLVQTTISLVNLAGRKLGIAEGTADERDLGQVREGIEALRALLPLLEARNDTSVEPIRDAVSQLQLAYAREVGAPAAPAGPAAAPAGASTGASKPDGAGGGEQGGGAGPAQSSGRLWVPGS